MQGWHGCEYPYHRVHKMLYAQRPKAFFRPSDVQRGIIQKML